jgi:hypothetical protein
MGTRALTPHSEHNHDAHPTLLEAAIDRAQHLAAGDQGATAGLDEAGPGNILQHDADNCDLPEEHALLREMSDAACQNARVNKTRRLGLQTDQDFEDMTGHSGENVFTAQRCRGSCSLTPLVILVACVSGPAAGGENDQWVEGQQLLEELMLKCGESSGRSLLRYYSQRYEQGTETETLAGLQHLAVYKSYTLTVRSRSLWLLGTCKIE